MSTFHLSIKSGRPGKASLHAEYITRQGRFRKGAKAQDIVATGFGNLPPGFSNPHSFWIAADTWERRNGAAYREFEYALPHELTLSQNRELVEEFVAREMQGRPYEWAIHCNVAALGEQPQPHVHLMFSDRVPDGIVRSPELYFRRYNASQPERGGCRKLSGGKDPLVFREEVLIRRENAAALQNEFLERYGHDARVDARSNKDRGIDRPTERHLGAAAIRAMSVQEKRSFTEARAFIAQASPYAAAA